MIMRLVGEKKNEGVVRRLVAKIRERGFMEIVQIKHGREITLEPVARYTAFSNN